MPFDTSEEHITTYLSDIQLFSNYIVIAVRLLCNRNTLDT